MLTAVKAHWGKPLTLMSVTPLSSGNSISAFTEKPNHPEWQTTEKSSYAFDHKNTCKLRIFPSGISFTSTISQRTKMPVMLNCMLERIESLRS